MRKDRKRNVVGVVVESTGKCKLKMHRFGTSDCRKVRRSERELARAPCFASYVMRYATWGTGRFCAASGNRIRACNARCVRTVGNWPATTTTQSYRCDFMYVRDIAQTSNIDLRLVRFQLSSPNRVRLKPKLAKTSECRTGREVGTQTYR